MASCRQRPPRSSSQGHEHLQPTRCIIRRVNSRLRKGEPSSLVLCQIAEEAGHGSPTSQRPGDRLGVADEKTRGSGATHLPHRRSSDASQAAARDPAQSLNLAQPFELFCLDTLHWLVFDRLMHNTCPACLSDQSCREVGKESHLAPHYLQRHEK